MKSENKRRILLSTAVLAAGTAAAQEDVRPPLFQVGSVDVRPNLNYGATYDDNVFLAHKSGNKDDDLVHTLSPGVTLGAGDYRGQGGSFFSANYQANLLFFQDNTGSNAENHNASISFGGGEKLSWRFDQILVSANDADVLNLAARGRVARRTWSSALGTVYDLSEKTNLETSFGYVLNDFSPGPGQSAFDSQRLQGKMLLDYQMTPKLFYGLGGTFGYDQVDGFSNSLYEQINGRIVWETSPKLALRAGVGVEFRQYQGSNIDRANLVFDVGADWKLSPLTVASLGATRGIAPSNSVGNQSATRTGVSATVAHRFGDRYSAILATGYTNSDLSAARANAAGSQEDDYWYIRPGFAARLADRLALAAFYQYRRNDSDAPANGSDFTNHQVGASVTYAF